MKVWLCRHGQTSWNAQGRLQGHEDISLDATGLEQAQRIHAWMNEQDVVFDVVYCSDLLRTKQTLQPMLEKNDLNVVVYDSRLREQHLGRFQGFTRNELLNSEDGNLFSQFKKSHDIDAPGGER